MAGLSTLGAHAAPTNPQVERIAALAASVGQISADAAILAHPLPLTDEVKARVQVGNTETVVDMLDQFRQISDEERKRFHEIATVAMERRLAYHATQQGGRA